MSIYCNIETCTNWIALETPKQMKKNIGYVPIGNIGIYNGRCGLEAVSITTHTARGQSTIQTLPICGNYVADSSKDFSTNQVKDFSCSEKRCAFYLDNNQCDKINHDYDLYIGWTTAFYGTDKKEVPNCKSFAHRKRENAFDWGKAAKGFR